MQEKYGLQSIALLGSFAKKQAKQNSDIDLLLLVELKTSYVKNYFGLLLFLEKQFPQPVELIGKGSHTDLNFLSSIENNLIYAG